MRFELTYSTSQNGNVEFRVAGRLHSNSSRSGASPQQGAGHNTGNTQNTSGHWLDSNLDNGARYVFGQTIGSSGNSEITSACGQAITITDLINTGDIAKFNKGSGHIIDFVIVRNRNEGGGIGGSTSDNMNGSVFLHSVTVHFEH